MNRKLLNPAALQESDLAEEVVTDDLFLTCASLYETKVAVMIISQEICGIKRLHGFVGILSTKFYHI